MSFLVQLADDAARDLEEICEYIGRHDSPGRADHVLQRIEKAFSSLSEHPQRGSYPKELLDIGIREYLACMSHHPTVEARDKTAMTSLRLLAVLDVQVKYTCARQAARASS